MEEVKLDLSLLNKKSWSQEVLANLHPSWKTLLYYPPSQEPDLSKIITTLVQKYEKTDICPAPRDIFAFTHFTNPNTIRIVILGQDPYYNGDANGLAFASDNTMPASLKRIFELLLREKQIESIPTTGNLKSWAAQGILLVNTALTTTRNNPGQHIDLWRDWTRTFLASLANIYEHNKKKLIFVLWGNPSKSYAPYFSKHIVLTACHPSPRTNNAWFETKTFQEIANYYKINWSTAKANYSICYTDGSWNNKHEEESRSGYAVVFTEGLGLHNVLYGSLEKGTGANNKILYPTNIRAEGEAIYRALEHAMTLPTYVLVICTDSQLWIDMMYYYIPNWLETGIDPLTKSNPDLTTRVWNMYQKLIQRGTYVVFRYIPSHDQDKWSEYAKNSFEYKSYIANEYVDQLAKKAKDSLQPGQHLRA